MFQALQLLSRAGPHLVELTLRSVTSLPVLRQMLGLVPNVLHLRIVYDYPIRTQLDPETVDCIRVTLGARLKSLSLDSNCLGVGPLWRRLIFN